MNVPLPAKRAFLSDLHNLPPGSKARFLGCVTNYKSQTGIITLEHHYPTTSPTPASVPVDITLLRESIEASDLQVGAWLNVLGFVRERKVNGSNQANCSPESQTRHGSIYVEAVVVFSAGAFRVGEYERALQGWIDVDRMIKKAD